MGRMFGKTRSRSRVTTRKEKAAGHRPRGPEPSLAIVVVAARDTLMALTFDGYTLRLRPFWLPSYASLDCLSLSLSLSTVLLLSFLCVFFSTVFSFSFYTRPHSFSFFLFFYFPLTSSKVLHVRVCVRSFFFSLVLARRRRSSADLESNSQGRARAAFGVT